MLTFELKSTSPACLIFIKLHFIFFLLSPAKQGKLSSLFPPHFDSSEVSLLGASWAERSDSALVFTKDLETWTLSVSLFAEWHRIVAVLGQNEMTFEGRHRRTDAEAETPILWPPHAKSWLIGKDPDAGRDWGKEKKGTTEDEMAGWHHWCDGCVWVNSGSWWWTGRPGVLWFMGSQRVGHNWATELHWTDSSPAQSKHQTTVAFQLPGGRGN